MNHKIYVWDIAIRVFHWSLVFAFIAAYISGEIETGLHQIIGYVILGLISFRLLWGFIGSRYARFSQFVYPLQTVITYLRCLFNKPKHYTGHNPAGGWMVILLLLMLFMISMTGLKLQAIEDREHNQPSDKLVLIVDDLLGGEIAEHEEETEEFWEDWHEMAVNLTILLIFIHILGVIVASRLHGENLVKAMLSGYKIKQE